MRIRIAFLACLLFPVLLAGAQPHPPLTVVNGRPSGETSDLGESREITIVFSEPMVVLGRIPAPVTVPFFRIEPALRGQLSLDRHPDARLHA